MYDNIIILLLIIVILMILYLIYTKYKKEYVYKPIIKPYPQPQPQQHLIGGCSGTRYQCCSDGVTPKYNEKGSNC